MGRPAQKAARNSVVDTWQMPPPIPGSVRVGAITRPSTNPLPAVIGPTVALKENVSPGGTTVPSISRDPLSMLCTRL